MLLKKLQQETKPRKKKRNRLLYLAQNKLDCVEMLVSKSVQDVIIDHNEFLGIMKKKTMTIKKMKLIRVK